MKELVLESSIWDLHIHTCLCPKGSGGFSLLSVDDYVDLIVDEIEAHPALEMISFTDHNQISLEVYQEFLSRNTDVTLLPGVEMDVKIEGIQDYKHIICYFNFDLLQPNQWLSFVDFSKRVNVELTSAPKDLSKLLSFFINQKCDFVLSPHAFKQGQRGLNYEWSSEEIVRTEPQKFMDQFFVFWEAAGNSEIARANEFLINFFTESKISIIAFSDSSDIDKFRDYLNKPCQFFRSLGNFKGLQMVSTEITRICRQPETISVHEKGNTIGRVSFCGCDVLFSTRLNSVIGGRGSGKSLLLDAMGLELDPKSRLGKERVEFVKKYPIKVYYLTDEQISGSQFHVEYFEQAYIGKIFSSKDYDNDLFEYFSSAFIQVPTIDSDEIMYKLKQNYTSQLNQKTENTIDNISGLIEKYRIVSDEKIKLNLHATDKIARVLLDYYNGDRQYAEIINNSKVVPTQLKHSINVANAVLTFQKTIADCISSYNSSILDEKYVKNLIIDEYINYKSKRSKTSKAKKDIENLLLQTFDNESYTIINRVRIVNALLNSSIGFRESFEEKKEFNGETPKAFIFINRLSIEHPIDFWYRHLQEYWDGNKIKIEQQNFAQLLNAFCFNNAVYLKQSKKEVDMLNSLAEFSLQHTENHRILYLLPEVKNYQDIKSFSPGMQSNILLEYLVHKETDVPLLIDQPEDNVDNSTIYTQIRKWFSDMKKRRQLIVVTHDANIVINSDSENLIIASQASLGVFKYTYGALELDKNIDNASQILDGGKDAVKRRMMKYGE